MTRKSVCRAVAAAVLLAATAVLIRGVLPRPDPVSISEAQSVEGLHQTSEQDPGKTDRPLVIRQASPCAEPGSRAAAAVPPEAVVRPSLVAADETLLNTIRAAFAVGNVKKLGVCAAQALKSDSLAVRKETVRTLAVSGDQLIPELLPFLADPDEDVRAEAIAAFRRAVSEMEDERERAKIIASAAKVLKNEELIRSLMSDGSRGLDDARVDD